MQPGENVSHYHRFPQTSKADGFTLVELLVACAVLMTILVVIFNIVSQTSNLWRSTSSKITAFQSARAAFEAVTRNLSQATLNHYIDYYDANWRHTTAAGGQAANYGRFSELEFVSGPAAELLPSASGKVTHAVFFQAPLGRTDDEDLRIESPGMLNAAGYFVEFGPASTYSQIPRFLQGRTASDHPGFRLIEWVQPSEKLTLYDSSYNAGQQWAWFQQALASRQYCRVMAENIIALVILPRGADNTALGIKYSYDSTTATYVEDRSYLLPPLLQVTMVAIDEDSAQRLRDVYGTSQPPLVPAGAFQTIASYDHDLAELESVLAGNRGGPRLNYRVFSTTISTKEGG